MICCGIDLIDVNRVTAEERFMKRVCTENEIAIVRSSKRSQEKIAAIFAIKEAFAKAVGTGIGEKLRFHDIEISYTAAGQPTVKYLGKNGGGISGISCSVSHEGPILAALVVIEGNIS